MKHNLETIKEKLDAHFQNQNRQSFDVLQEEINGFEKELREMKPSAEEVLIHSMHDNVKLKIALSERRNRINEILGETK